MSALATALAPLVPAGLLGTAGAAKLFGPGIARHAPRTALARLLRGGGRAAVALRALGAAELLLAAALVTVPTTWVPGAAAALLGAGFLGYLTYARMVAPRSSCGCTARDEGPVGRRAFVRATAVLVGGAAAAMAQEPWWTTVARRPAPSLCLVLGTAVVLAAFSGDFGRRWRLPLRRMRLRLTGHPLAATGPRAGGGAGAPVPVAATVELLENSRAWQSASPVVRSALLDHWDEGGWRILQFAGVHGSGEHARPVLVLFALDAMASLDSVREPAVRVSVIDADSGAAVAAMA